ncbi:ribbon-helix-helix protein, CopG family [Synechococcus sp. ROS8604]|uniref:ribbon-helix-helix protein, CopG family n=1 Tax=Synechococcus sp. ROS8604 TaxID=1442557 RepID=UPI001645A5B6|nr:ribbon-helix-helix protein, CopG family [Synechococcus sp. ROS8604]
MKTINIRISTDMLAEIDAAASVLGQDRSNFLRAAAAEKLQGLNSQSPSKDQGLLKDLKLADERSRVVVRDILLRLKRLEAATFPEEGDDPFA